MNVTAIERGRYKTPLRGVKNKTLEAILFPVPRSGIFVASLPNSRDIHVVAPKRMVSMAWP